MTVFGSARSYRCFTGLSSVADRRKKVCYFHRPQQWLSPPDMSEVRLEQDGKGYQVYKDEEDGAYYVTEDDGERTYLVYG